MLITEAKLENHDIELGLGRPTSGGSVPYRFLCLKCHRCRHDGYFRAHRETGTWEWPKRCCNNILTE
jgi:hypothetical protein